MVRVTFSNFEMKNFRRQMGFHKYDEIQCMWVHTNAHIRSLSVSSVIVQRVQFSLSSDNKYNVSTTVQYSTHSMPIRASGKYGTRR